MINGALTNCTVLVTRPLKQSIALIKLIQQAGGKPLVFPTLEIADPQDITPLIKNLQQLKNFDVAIFVSANAVHKTLRHYKRPWPNGLVTLAVGQATARALKDYHITTVRLPAEQFNSEGLLALPLLQQVNAKKIILFAGENGRDLLAETLIERGASVNKIAAYRRIQPQTQLLWRADLFDIMVITSTESLTNLLAMIAPANPAGLFSKPLVVLSQRISAYAKKLGFIDIIVTAEPSDIAILNSLITWYNDRH